MLRASLLLVLTCLAAVLPVSASASREERQPGERSPASAYVVTTFQTGGHAYVHAATLGARERPGPDSGAQSIQDVKRLIREARPQAPDARDGAAAEPVLTGLWGFPGTSDGATRARALLCRLEGEGYQPWTVSACHAASRAARHKEPALIREAARPDRPLGATGSSTDSIAPETRLSRLGETTSANAPPRPAVRRGPAHVLVLGALWRYLLPFVPLFVLVLLVGRLRRALSRLFGLPFRLVGPLFPGSRGAIGHFAAGTPDAIARDVEERAVRAVMHQPLRQIVRSDLLLDRLQQTRALAETPGGPWVGDDLDHRAVPAAWVARYKEALQRAATETNLSVEVVATVLLAEQRAVPTTIPIETALTTEIGALARAVQEAIGHVGAHDDARVLVFTSELVTRGTAHALAFLHEYVNTPRPVTAVRDAVLDIAATHLPDALPLGLGQRDVASLIDLGIHRDARLATEWRLEGLRESALRRELRRRLLDEPDNVRLCAKVVRRLVDSIAELAKRRPDLARKALDVAAVPAAEVEANRLLTFVRDASDGRLDLSRFARHPDDWTPGHVSFVGWRYHARHLGATDTVHGEPEWAGPFLAAFVDIVHCRVLE